jgi:hypothetical protein
MNLIIFKSKPKNNFFAPEWEYFLYEDMLQNINFKKVSNLILKKEKQIIDKYPINNNNKSLDGYTNLGGKSLTSRFPYYNVLKWNNDEIKKIKKQIIEIHNIFLNKLKVKIPKKLYIQCWANVMRKGEEIKPHLHDVSPDTYLGGNICIQCKNTSTYYINPINQINDPEVYDSKNIVGKITLFQGNIPHYTDIHDDDLERITIAFDLSLKKINKNYINIL